MFIVQHCAWKKNVPAKLKATNKKKLTCISLLWLFCGLKREISICHEMMSLYAHDRVWWAWCPSFTPSSKCNHQEITFPYFLSKGTCFFKERHTRPRYFSETIWWTQRKSVICHFQNRASQNCHCQHWLRKNATQLVGTLINMPFFLFLFIFLFFSIFWQLKGPKCP